MAYDKSEWHYGGEYPKELPEKNGGTHIGFFIAWAINKNLFGEIHNEDAPESIKALKEKKITGRDFFEKECEGKFWEIDLNREGNAFAKHYYESDIYFSDYVTILGADHPTMYHVEDTWENYQKIAAKITEQYIAWKKSDA